MKSLLIGMMFLVYAMMPQQNDYISIEYIGINDKPIQTIIISKRTIEKPGCINFLVNDKVYNKIKNIIQEYKEINQDKKYEFESFKLIVNEQNTKNLTYYFDREKAIQLFDRLIETLKQPNSNKELLFAIETNKKRIRL